MLPVDYRIGGIMAQLLRSISVVTYELRVEVQV